MIKIVVVLHRRSLGFVVAFATTLITSLRIMEDVLFVLASRFFWKSNNSKTVVANNLW